MRFGIVLHRNSATCFYALGAKAVLRRSVVNEVRFFLLLGFTAMRSTSLLTVCLCQFFFGCSSGPVRLHTRTRPPALVDTAAFPADCQEAVNAVALSISAGGEDPKKFFATVEHEKGGRVLVFHLWHSSAFEVLNRG